MTTAETIREAVDLLAADPRPKQIILFGSQARADSAADSDSDLLVIGPEVADPGAEMVRLRWLLRPPTAAVDMLACSRDEVARWGSQPGTTLHLALQKGQVLRSRIGSPICCCAPLHMTSRHAWRWCMRPASITPSSAFTSSRPAGTV